MYSYITLIPYKINIHKYVFLFCFFLKEKLIIQKIQIEKEKAIKEIQDNHERLAKMIVQPPEGDLKKQIVSAENHLELAVDNLKNANVKTGE